MNIHGRRIVSPSLLTLRYWCTVKKRCGCGSFSVVSDVENFGNKAPSDLNTPNNESDNSLDSFTNKIVEERIRKWEENIIELCKIKGLTRDKYDELQDKKAVRNHISSMKTVDFKAPEISSNHDYVEGVLQNCKEKDMLSEQRTCLALLQISATNGDKQSIHTIKNFCKTRNPNFYELHTRFDHYLGEAVWKSGNIEEALVLFEDVYKQNIMLRLKIKARIKMLMKESIYGKSEAVLVLLMKFSKQFADSYSDYSLLSYVWEICFLSDWFSDVQIASSLLENYPELRSYLSERVFHLSSLALSSHKLDLLHRLFEVLLKYEMIKEYEIVLRSFFDYTCMQKDFAACAAIINSCKELNVSLSAAQQTKYLVLLCGKDTSSQTIITHTQKFKFKF